MGVSLDGVRVPLSRRRVANIVRAVLRAGSRRHAFISLTFVGDRAIRALNRRHLRHDRVTDVIAFAHHRAARNAPIIGDVYIAPDVARRNAASEGTSAREELVRLVVHGTLHVLGHDHPARNRERSAMWKRQERLVRALASVKRRRAPTRRAAAAGSRS